MHMLDAVREYFQELAQLGQHLRVGPNDGGCVIERLVSIEHRFSEHGRQHVEQSTGFDSQFGDDGGNWSQSEGAGLVDESGVVSVQQAAPASTKRCCAWTVGYGGPGASFEQSGPATGAGLNDYQLDAVTAGHI